MIKSPICPYQCISNNDIFVVVHHYQIYLWWWWFGGGLVTKSCLTLATPWTVARQAPLSMGFSRQEYWSWLPFPSLGDLPDPGIEPGSPAGQAHDLPTELGGEQIYLYWNLNPSIKHTWPSQVAQG